MNKKVRVIVCQKEFPNSVEFIEKELSRIPKADFFVTAEHSFFWTCKETPDKDETTIQLSELAKKHRINLIIGGCMQKTDGKYYFSCLYITKKGKIYWHSKKDKSRLKNQGLDDGIFPSKFGNIGILICVEIEDHMDRENCLRHKPSIVFNPAFIFCSAENPVYKSSSELMAKKLSKFALDGNCVIVRCDHPYPKGMATSQVICPDHTYFFESHKRNSMYYEFSLDFSNNFQSVLSLCPPYLDRSYEIDNMGNRYNTHFFENMRTPIRKTSLLDKRMLIACLHPKRVELWNVNTIKKTKTFQRAGRYEIPENSKLICSQKDSLVACLHEKVVCAWNSRTGDTLVDEEFVSEKFGKFQEFVISGNFVSLAEGNKVSFWGKDLKLLKTIELGDKNIGEMFYHPDDPNYVIVKSEDGKSLIKFDLTSKNPLFSVDHDCAIKIVKFDDSQPKELLYFSDEKNYVFRCKKDGDVDILVKEYKHGINDFLMFRDCAFGFIVDSKNGSLGMLRNGELVYDFFGQTKGIDNIIFDGMTKIFVTGKNFVRVYQFQVNRRNVFLGKMFV